MQLKIGIPGDVVFVYLCRFSTIELELEFSLRLIKSPDPGFGCFKVYEKAERNVKAAQAIHFLDAVFPGHDHENSGLYSHLVMCAEIRA